MKYILLLCLIAVIMAIAQGVCRQYRERYALFEAFGDFFRQMRLNLNFQKQKIKEILNQTTLKRTNQDIYKTYLNYLENGTPIDIDFVRILEDAEQEQLTSMLRSLGKNDTSGELMQLDAYDVYLKDKIETTRREKDKYCPLITKLSLLFAIGLAILFI